MGRNRSLARRRLVTRKQAPKVSVAHVADLHADAHGGCSHFRRHASQETLWNCQSNTADNSIRIQQSQMLATSPLVLCNLSLHSCGQTTEVSTTFFAILQQPLHKTSQMQPHRRSTRESAIRYISLSTDQICSCGHACIECGASLSPRNTGQT